MFNNATSISFRGGEVKQIVRTRDNVIIYQKEEELSDNYIEIEFTGQTFSSSRADNNGLIGNNVFIDYGDGNIVEYTGDYTHIYASTGNYTIKIYGVTSLGEYCFAYCTSLTSIDIPDSITSFGDYCFRKCTKLASINIPNSITSLGEYCFAMCANLTSIDIPDSITSLGSNCFSRCTSLTSITIPNSIKNIKTECFSDCTNLTEIILEWDNSSEILEYNVTWLDDCNSFKYFLIPLGTKDLYLEKNYPSNLLVENNFIKLNITGDNFSINNSFVYTDTILVDWGDDTELVEYTSGSLLSHTYSTSANYLVKIYGNIITLGPSCFYNCTGLTSITIPDTVTGIGPDCFAMCANLTSITIPNSLTNFGEYCFYGCTGLIEIVLSWKTSNNIIQYNNLWLDGCTSFDHFLIPDDTANLYIEKNYPSVYLKQESGKPIPISIDLTGTQSILSYEDKESCVLTATVLDAWNNSISGATVELYKMGLLWDTLITDSNGTVTKTYSSEGIGDIIFEAKCNLLTKTYNVEDCTYYNPDKVSGSRTFNIPLPNKFSLEYTLKQGLSNYSSPYIDIGDNTDNRMLVGQYEWRGGNGLIVYKSSSTTYSYNTNIPQNQENTVHFTYDGINYNYWLNDLTPKIVSDKGVTLTKLIHQEGATTVNNYIKDIKIKPLPSLSLDVNNLILSYSDSDSTTFTATHSLGAGKTVKLYNASDDSLIGTMTDNGDCTYSYTYNSQGIGDLNVYVSDGNITSEDMLIEDYQYYTNNMQKIKSNFITDSTSASGRTIYISPFTFNSDVEIEFKLKNIPYNWVLGFGSDGTNWNGKGLWFKLQSYNQNKASIMYVDTGGTVRDVGITTSYDTSTVFTIKSEDIHKIYWYLNGTIQGYRDTQTTIPLGLRVDIFDNQDYDIDYIKVKKL